MGEKKLRQGPGMFTAFCWEYTMMCLGILVSAARLLAQ